MSSLHDKDVAFIIGSARSGTTFLAKLLDSSPSVLYRHEPDAALKRPGLPYLIDTADYDTYRADAQSYLEDLCAQNDAKSSGTRPIFRKDFRGPVGQFSMTGFIYLAKLLERLGLDVAVPDLVTRPSSHTAYLLKSVDSPCRVPLFAEALPSFRCLHLVRHPCAVIASFYRGQKTGHMNLVAYTDSLFSTAEAARYPFTQDDMRSRTWPERFAYQWMVQNNKIYAELNGGENYRLVLYEKLCEELDSEMQAICQFCNLDYDAQMKSHVDQTINFEGTSAYFGVKRNLLGSLYRWKSTLPEEEIKSVEDIIRHSEIGRLVLEASQEALAA